MFGEPNDQHDQNSIETDWISSESCPDKTESNSSEFSGQRKRPSISDHYSLNVFTPVYLLVDQTRPLSLCTWPLEPELRRFGRLEHALYVSKDLRCVSCVGDAFDMPGLILVKFVKQERPAPIRECFRLTVNLFGQIVEACDKAARAWSEGGLSESEYTTLTARFEELDIAYSRLDTHLVEFESSDRVQ